MTPFTDDEVETIIDMLKAGKSYREIALALPSATKSKVGACLRRLGLRGDSRLAGLRPTDAHISAEQSDAIVDLYEKKWQTFAKIARTLDLPSIAVEHHYRARQARAWLTGAF